MKFKLFGEMIFEAKNLDDAFMKLSNHFKGLSEGDENLELECGTDIHLKTVKEGGEKK